MAATNPYFDETGLSVSDGTIAKASQLNAVTNETNKAFDLITGQLNNIQSGTQTSYEWATNDQGDLIDATNYPDQYSSFAYALEAMAWATGTAGVDTTADGVTTITGSAREYSEFATTEADRAQTAADGSEGSELLAQEWAEKPYSQSITGHPGSYSSLHHSIVSAAQASSSATSASESSDFADASEASSVTSSEFADKSQEWATNPEDDPVEPGLFSAYHWAQKAEEIVAADGVADINVTAPITVDKTTPLIPIIGFSGDKTDVGLDQVDNTSDLDKPISDLTQAALDDLGDHKVTSISGVSPITVTGSGLTPVVGFTGTKDDVGLDQVDNTADLDKPVSGDTQAALDLKEDDLGLPGDINRYLTSDLAGARSWDVIPPGVPAGGLQDEVLTKATNADYDMTWAPGGSAGGGGGLEWQEITDGVEDLIVNGDFASDTGWSKELGVSGSVDIAGGQCAVSNNGDTGQVYAYQTAVLTTGVTYEITIDCESYTTSWGITVGNTYHAINESGVLTGHYEAVSNGNFRIGTPSAGSLREATFNSVKITEVGVEREVEAESGKGYPIDTTDGQVTLVLPANPVTNDQVGYKDALGTFSIYPLEFNLNGSLVEGTDSFLVNGRGAGGTLVYSGDPDVGWLLVDATPMTTVQTKPMIHVQDQKPSGTDGGSSVAGDNPRDLNTVLTNDIAGASLGSNTVTLPAGDYFVQARCPNRESGTSSAKIRVYILVDGVKTLFGQSMSNRQGAATSQSYVSGKITLPTSSVISVTHYISLEETTATGLGLSTEDGNNEVYTDLQIWRLDQDKVYPNVQDPAIALSKPLMHVQDQKALGVFGGNSLLGPQIRTLNTILTNDISGASLGGNAVTLPAGKYYIDCYVPTRQVSSGYVTTQLLGDGSTVLLQGTGTSGGSSSISQVTVAHGRITLTESTTLTVNHIWSLATVDGLGRATNLGTHEVYTDMRIWQIDAVAQTPVIKMPVVRPISGAYVTGDIYGGELAYVDLENFQVAPVSCMSDDLSTQLFIDATTNVLLTSYSPSLSTVYNVFIVKYTADGTYGIEVDTDVDGGNLTGYIGKRWLGFVRTSATNDIEPFKMAGSDIVFTNPIVITTVVGSEYTEADGSTFVPAARVEQTIYGSECSIAAAYTWSYDGITIAFTTHNAGPSYYPMTPPVNSLTMWIKSTQAGTDAITIYSVKLRR